MYIRYAQFHWKRCCACGPRPRSNNGVFLSLMKLTIFWPKKIKIKINYLCINKNLTVTDIFLTSLITSKYIPIIMKDSCIESWSWSQVGLREMVWIWETMYMWSHFHVIFHRFRLIATVPSSRQIKLNGRHIYNNDIVT